MRINLKEKFDPPADGQERWRKHFLWIPAKVLDNKTEHFCILWLHSVYVAERYSSTYGEWLRIYKIPYLLHLPLNAK